MTPAKKKSGKCTAPAKNKVKVTFDTTTTVGVALTQITWVSAKDPEFDMWISPVGASVKLVRKDLVELRSVIDAALSISEEGTRG